MQIYNWLVELCKKMFSASHIHKLNFSFVILLFISQVEISARVFYVATEGNDNWSGTIDRPWATWEHAFETAYHPGDTTYFRGGVYYVTSSSGRNYISGTKARPVCFFAYPGETPILDGINCTRTSSGLAFYHGDHIKLRGLTVRNFLQLGQGDSNCVGIYFYYGGHITIEQCTTHDIGYRGFYFYAPDSLFVYNCDSYNIVDSLSSTPGNAGDGYIMTGGGDTTDYAIFRGCRAWHVSDDGWDVHTYGSIELDSCWAFDCGGYEEFNWGNGMKLNLSIDMERQKLSRKVTNCLLLYNRGSGITTNDNNRTAIPMNVFNNTSAWNGTFGNLGWGYTIFNTASSSTLERRRVFRNNIAYANSAAPVQVGSNAEYTHSNNTWDSDVNLTQDDFISLDSSGLRGARQPDGSLPFLDGFLKLATNSDLIDAGMDVGLSYNGDAPDIGAWEHNLGPSVELTSPEEGNIFSAPSSITLSAVAEDLDGTVAKVEFYSGEVKIGEQFSEPWTFIWNNVPVGTHSLRAKAFDNGGLSGTSMVVVVSYISSSLVLYPNPNDGIFTLTLPDLLEESTRVYVMSIEGKVIYSDTVRQDELAKQFDLPFVSPGFYTLILEINEGPIAEKFIIQ